MAKSKYDGILEAVRLSEDGQVQIARIFERRGPIFSDRFLVDRDDLIGRIKSGQKFLTGKRLYKMGSMFHTGDDIRVVSSKGNEVLVVGGGEAEKDTLQSVPRFLMSTVFLSIIIPAHNEEERLPPSLALVANFVRQQPYSIEVIVVENGSTDRTLEVAQSSQATMPYLQVIQESQKGKGLAVRTGMLAAKGKYRIFCDADFSMPVDELSKFIPEDEQSYDIAIASRELPEIQTRG